ncbi:hypothetical protein [Gracilinema caldarium]|jgi:hypothetical protein|uniref:hypothetical protein n=1 Tax=Gracilinema caldarium TaxID=215591 RepID=UPI0026EA7CCC|nr:hypothetical protein [Gracilinema caldarium]
MELPLRLSLRYNPLFLELGRHLNKETWGVLQGGQIQGTVTNRKDIKELLALFCYLFGIPEQEHINEQDSVFHAVFRYPSFAIQFIFTLVPNVSLHPTLWGSLSLYPHQVIELRFGTDNFIAFAPRESEVCHMALPEGRSEQYRALDLEQGAKVLPGKLERAVDDYIKSLSL